MYVKFCGFTTLADITTAVQLGVDAVGLVFYPKSSRAVTAEQAAALVKAVPAFTTIVALTVNMSEDELIALADRLDFDLIQFHGDETPDECQKRAKRVNKRWIKALRINADTETQDSVRARIDAFAAAGASSILLDAYHAEHYGGTGNRFDWSLIPTDSALPIILAGGLSAQNVAATLDLSIYGVDVSGGIESAKGKKDAAKMRGFMKAVKRDRWHNVTDIDAR